MSPRKAAASTSARRTQLRAGELATPTDAARNINDLLTEMQQRIEALERVLFVDVTVTVDSNGVMSPCTVTPPAWPVRGVFLARAWDDTNKLPAVALRPPGWQVDKSVITIALWVGDVSPGTRYDLTLRLEG